MKPTKPPAKLDLQIKSSARPPNRISTTNTAHQNRDTSPDHISKAFLKIKMQKDSQDTSNSGLFSNTPTKRSPSNHNRRNITETGRSITEILRDRKSVSFKRHYTIWHIYTYEVPKIADEYDNEGDGQLLGLLLSQKEEEVKLLRSRVAELEAMDHSMGGFDPMARATEIDNTIFAFEEERVRLETRCSEMERELETAKEQLKDSDERQSALIKEVVELKKRLDKTTQSLLEAEEKIDEFSGSLTMAEATIKKAKTLSHVLADSLNEYFDASGAAERIKLTNHDIHSSLDLIISCVRANNEDLKTKTLKGGLKRSFPLDSIIDGVQISGYLCLNDDAKSSSALDDKEEWVSMQEFNEVVTELADLRLKVHKISNYLAEHTGFVLDDSLEELDRDSTEAAAEHENSQNLIKN